MLALRMAHGDLSGVISWMVLEISLKSVVTEFMGVRIMPMAWQIEPNAGFLARHLALLLSFMAEQRMLDPPPPFLQPCSPQFDGLGHHLSSIYAAMWEFTRQC